MYVPANMGQEAALQCHELCYHFFGEVLEVSAVDHLQSILQLRGLHHTRHLNIALHLCAITQI